MAIFRKVHTSFWSDPFVADLSDDKKLFYLYILTNERTKQCGIYEISKKQICFDLGYSIDTVSILLKYFISVDKIRYSESTKEVAVKNWNKYNKSSSPKVVKCLESELLNVKDRLLIEYVYPMYTLPQEEQEENNNKKTILDFLNHQEAKKADPKFYEFIERYSRMLIREFPSDKETIENIELSLYAKPARSIIKMASFDEITYVINKALNNEFWKPQLFNLLTIEKNWLKIKNTPDAKS